ncbi:MAG: prepilin-type N-terminal cleavage/methylation domain-containing protein [Gammaproteobacteria bacterium]|nr:prepilin-type N-terminal cleavage/methylation domain-containing protein [Gammaproteobacteria bacterium]MBY0544649.1 prepilin-type N-terminal cleavage/methylation domain-containing protein [Gammaproteobacteria bacterium]
MVNILRIIRQRGIGLLELMLSLAIIAILLIMATRYYQTASNNNAMNSAIDMANAVKSGVKNYMNSNMNSKTLPTVTELETNGYLPQAYANPASANPWGGDICIGTPGGTCSDSSAGSISNSTFAVTMAGIPTAICNQVAARVQATLAAGGVETATCSSGSGGASGATSSTEDLAIIYLL